MKSIENLINMEKYQETLSWNPRIPLELLEKYRPDNNESLVTIDFVRYIWNDEYMKSAWFSNLQHLIMIYTNILDSKEWKTVFCSENVISINEQYACNLQGHPIFLQLEMYEFEKKSVTKVIDFFFNNFNVAFTKLGSFDPSSDKFATILKKKE